MTRILVTGGGGFLGGHIVRALLERGDEVGSLTRSDQPELRELGVEVHRGDISNPEDVALAIKGYDAIIHTAAMVNPWGDPDAFFRANVTGTSILLDACQTEGITRFVFTSSPSAVFQGIDLINAPTEVPYPARFPSPYGETKAMSEQLVQAAHNPDAMACVSLRPQLMWGPGDPHLLPLLIHKTRLGTLKQVGHADTMVDVTFITNAAQAHLDALDALDKSPDDPTYPGGQNYFISNDEPVKIWEFITEMLELVGEPGPKGKVPRWLAAWTGRQCERLWRLMGWHGEPPVSEFVVLKMCTHQWYDMGPARRDLGYNPKVSMAQGKQLWAQAHTHEP